MSYEVGVAMRPRVLVISLAAVLTAGVAQAEWTDADRFDFAYSLGNVIAGEEVCGLSYDPAAVARLIERKVPADDMEFPASLQFQVRSHTRMNSKMSATEQAAFCAQVLRIAKSYAFVK